VLSVAKLVLGQPPARRARDRLAQPPCSPRRSGSRTNSARWAQSLL